MIPVVSTYRLQFSPSFTFKDAEKIVDYLDKLGISHVYASPIFEAMPGSVHGYDVTDFARVRSELGGEAGFREINKYLRTHSLGWIQDFVPNHMAMHPFNPYVHDILENGVESKYSGLFDIDWDHPAFGRGKICLPILGNSYEQELQSGRFSISRQDGFSLVYYDLNLPLAEKSLRRLTAMDASGIAHTNSNSTTLDSVLAEQHYSLKYWRTSAYEINYRRFFAVNGLICLREEDREVFDAVHEKLLDLVSKGYIDGLRIDHIDGLYDPRNYLQLLKKSINGRHVLVEKILQQDESMDEDWHIEGTTGYDFLARVTGVLCSEEGVIALTNIYEDFVGGTRSKEDSIYNCKKEVIEELFQGVVHNLSRQIFALTREDTLGKELTLPGLDKVISELLARIPVYRTYIEPGDSNRGIDVLKSVISKIRQERTDLTKETVLLDRIVSNRSDNREYTNWTLRLQQYMPAVFAKGVEDRILFRYNRLISLNEVGCDPYSPTSSVADFHKFNQSRQKLWPLTMNALSTHDTKLSEDIRARISVLSEIPDEWQSRIGVWRELNRSCSTIYGEKICPSANEEYYLYQLLLGSYPFTEEHSGEYGERVSKQFLKSVREAGMNSGWNDPDLGYEEGCRDFVFELLDRKKNSVFWQNFEEFGRIISFHGALNSLSQKILQLTCPGIPDIYQGTEVCRYNFTDPDNRRAVNFEEIVELFDGLSKNSTSLENMISTSLDDLDFGDLKLMVTHAILGLRRLHPELFLQGTYEPLVVSGEHSENLIAFARECNGAKIIVVVPRLTTGFGTLKMPIGRESWQDTSIFIPSSAKEKFEEILSGRTIEFDGDQQLRLGDILSVAPFSILFTDNSRK